jgi:hypothetical protein
MSFSSLDSIVTNYNSGKSLRIDWNKSTAGTFVAGSWYDFSAFGGYPIANAWAGTALAWRTCDELTGNGTQIFGIPHAGDVSSDFKHILNAMATTTSTTGNGMLMLVDLQGYWPGIALNSAATQNLSGTPSLRYANGEGCRLYFVTTTAAGATVQTVSLSYTNQTPTSGRALPTAPNMFPSSIVSQISHSRPHAAGVSNNYIAPFLPLANGDTGVQNVASVTFSAANTAGVAALCLARPLLTIPLPLTSIATERDYINQMTSFPRVLDGACLVWIYYPAAATAASSVFAGSLEYVWG